MLKPFGDPSVSAAIVRAERMKRYEDIRSSAAILSPTVWPDDVAIGYAKLAAEIGMVE